MILRTAISLAAQGRLSILIFHRVLREADPLLPSEPTAAQFDSLLTHVKSRFNILSLSDAIDRLRSGRLPGAALAITFDDGYADNLAVAAPILQAHGAPATIFIASGYLDGGCMFNDSVIEAFRSTRRTELNLTEFGLPTYHLQSLEDRRKAIDDVLPRIKYLPCAERESRTLSIVREARTDVPKELMLRRDSLKALIDSGFEIGAHTVTHPILANIDAAQATREIQQSKRDLEDIIGRPVSLFAYPNGTPMQDYRPEHVQMVRDAGFAGAVSGAWGAATRATDDMQLPRFTPWARRPLKFDLLMLRNLRERVQVAA